MAHCDLVLSMSMKYTGIRCCLTFAVFLHSEECSASDVQQHSGRARAALRGENARAIHYTSTK